MKRVTVHLAGKPYDIDIAQNTLAQWPLRLREISPGPFVLISDETVQRLYGKTMAARFNASDQGLLTLTVPAGESSKSLSQCDALYTRLIENRITRDAVMVALGGGVVGDLAGFVAATYLRGIRLIQIPTTLLAQVDSSVGGKVGVNHPLGKNLIGAFHHPEAVFIDPDVLHTLAPRELRAGLGEVLKYALIRDAELLEVLEEKLPCIMRLEDGALLESVIARCCQIKAEIVGLDEREQGIRAWLNFGHTIGHALEAATGFACYRHGEAIALGMAAALHLSASCSGLDQEAVQRGMGLIRALNPPPLPADVTTEMIFTHIAHDKKRRRSGQTWVLIERPGRAVLRDDVGDDRVYGAIEQLQDLSS